MSHASKSTANLQRQAAIAQEQITKNTQKSFAQLNDSTSIADSMQLSQALGAVSSAQIGSTPGNANAAHDTMAANGGSYLHQYNAVRAAAPSLLPSQERLQQANDRQYGKK